MVSESSSLTSWVLALANIPHHSSKIASKVVSSPLELMILPISTSSLSAGSSIATSSVCDLIDAGWRMSSSLLLAFGLAGLRHGAWWLLGSGDAREGGLGIVATALIEVFQYSSISQSRDFIEKTWAAAVMRVQEGYGFLELVFLRGRR